MQLVRRTLDTLRYLGDHPEGVPLAELAHQLDTPLATMHRLLGSLASEGFATRDSSKRYLLGAGALALARAYQSLERSLLESMNALARDIGETTFVSKWAGRRAICVAMAPGVRPLRLFVEVGQALPVHAAAGARVMAAHVDPDELEAVLERDTMEAFTAETLVTRDAVLDHMAMILERGYDYSYNELDTGVLAVSVPIRDPADGGVASITVAGPASSAADAVRLRDLWHPKVVAAAAPVACPAPGSSTDRGAEPPSSV